MPKIKNRLPQKIKIYCYKTAIRLWKMNNKICMLDNHQNNLLKATGQM